MTIGTHFIRNIKGESNEFYDFGLTPIIYQAQKRRKKARAFSPCSLGQEKLVTANDIKN